ncbi:hypothetical protein GEV33_003913 [Tenebrio molitor]|uniref:GST C-terminal domain-containing protein n=1 Tax=Tenebrio molitor TaxID=7067 RepID=A0A8J6HRE9_TENMO|nr:hypothetical protein GEV33_003913 [Tenebrio molitor]
MILNIYKHVCDEHAELKVGDTVKLTAQIAGSDSGFVPDGLLLFESKTSTDYHEEMNAIVFEDWFQKILTLVEPNSVVVMDNASYHSRREERLPTTSWRKANIQNWLSEKGISYDDGMVKTELMCLVKLHKQNYLKYAVDEMAKAAGVTVLRLPPYHCELNPIELIWAYNSIVVENSKEISTKNISAITESYKFLDKFLQSKNYLAGSSLTVADLCCVATVSTATIITPISTEKYPNLSTWYRTCKNLPFYEETNGAGLNKLDALVELKLGRPRTKDFCE